MVQYRKKLERRKGGKAMKKIGLIAAVCALVLVLAACAGVPNETPHTPTETTEATVPTESTQIVERPNILRLDIIVRTGYGREEIRSVTFLDTLANVPAEAWDASAAQNGAVLAWVEPNGELYDLYIGAEGGVWADGNCASLFRNYINVEKIDFGTAFHTENLRDMSGMFYHCESLRSLDLSGFDTSQVENMRNLFYGCHALEELDLSSFDTARVESMDYMFHGCRSLVSLDLTSFNTENVQGMDRMFWGCISLTDLDLSSFDLTNKNRYPYEMFVGCPAGRKWHFLQ